MLFYNIFDGNFFYLLKRCSLGAILVVLFMCVSTGFSYGEESSGIPVSDIIVAGQADFENSARYQQVSSSVGFAQNPRSGNVNKDSSGVFPLPKASNEPSSGSLDYSALGQIIVLLLFVILLIFFWNCKLKRFNQTLQFEVAKRRKLENVQHSLYQVAIAITSVSNIEEFFSVVHTHINEFIYANNFFIAIYDHEKDVLSFPYYTEDVEQKPPSRSFGKGLSEYVIRTGEPLFADQAKQAELIEQGELEVMGAPAIVWIGVPIVHEGQTLGVMAVQIYDDAYVLGDEDLEILHFISPYVGIALDRLQLYEQGNVQTLALKESEERFRTLFEESADAVVLLDGVTIFQCNRAAYKLLNMESRSELVGLRPSEFSPEVQFDGVNSREKALSIRDSSKLKSGTRFEWELKKVTGEVFPVEVLLTPISYRGQKIFHMVWRDITERKKAEAALVEREIKYRALFDHASDAIVLMDLKGQFISVNPGAVAMLRVHSEEEFMSFTPSKFMPQFQPNGLLSTTSLSSNLQTAVDLGSLEYEGVGKRADGEEFYVNVRLRSLVVSGETLILGTFRDVTEKRVGQEEIERSVSLLEATIESSADGILAVDGYGLVVAWNTRFADMWDIPEQILNDGIVSDIFGYLIDNIEGPEFAQESRWDFSLESEHDYVDELVLKDGRIIERYSNPQRIGSNVVGRVWSFRDITDRRLSEIALEESHHRLNDIIEFLPDPTIVIDVSGVVVAWNKAVEDITGVSKEEIIGKGNYEHALPFYGERRPILIDLAMLSEEDIPPEIYDSAERKGDMLYGEVYVPRAFGGKGAYLWGVACPLRDGAGNIYGSIECLRNVTDRRNVEQELNRAKLSAEAATRAKSEFLANMSHEIRTPMNSIMGLGHLVLSSLLDSTQRDTLEKMMSAADSLLSIIEDILDFSKIEAGRLVLEHTDFQLDDVLNKLCNVVAVKAEQKGLDFVLFVDPDVPYRVIGDPLRLEQILINLTNNAIKFTEEGEVALLISCVSIGDENVRLRFVVRDSGIGLGEEEIIDLFQSFTQADTSTTRRFGGTGLGLAITKSLVELMNGSIHVDSDPGKGSQFEFDAIFEVVESQPDMTLPFSSSGMNILVIEENFTSRKFIETSLEGMSSAVFAESTGEGGLAFLGSSLSESRAIDFIFVSQSLPDIDGINVISYIRAIAEFKDVPITLMVRAETSEKSRNMAIERGATNFISKPVTRDSLHQSVKKELDLSADSQEISESSQEAASFPELKERGVRALLVDDNYLNQQVAYFMLKKFGLNVVVVDNGRKALEALWADPYDIVFMDIQMPEMDGLTATRIIRSDEQYKDLPIIAMTAHAMQGDRKKSLAAGMNDHITKPISPVVILNALNKYVKSTAFSYVPISHDAELDGIEIPEVTGIDTAKGLSNVGGNKKGYLRILRGFRNDYSDFAGEISSLIGKKEFEKASVRLHSLKGVSGNIGAASLYDSCRLFERALHRLEEKRINAHLSGFVSEMGAVIDGLGELGGVELVESSNFTNDIEKSFELINALYSLLEEGNADSYDALEELMKYIDPDRFEGDLQELANHIDNFDFDECCVVLERIAAALGMVLRKRK
ncbi:PAS domain S-box protein [Maridesulfovibrio frigidus]|uniref:PAS domain S-box protein n=1 Tax=Maridesulfovibrio frigidus TaxID=340956 RepID=UPI0004E2500A|nr:PAS domain S-box protein [Maridesulfovibrio frigidus]